MRLIITKRYITLVLLIILLGLFLTGCSQKVVKYQYQDSSFKKSEEACSNVSCQINCSNLSCSTCSVKTEIRISSLNTTQNNSLENNTYQNTAGVHLLFKSGFEKGVYIDKNLLEYSEDYRIIRGSDHPNFSWPIDIFGAKDSGLHYIADKNQKAVFSRIKTTIGHKGTSTRALYQQENYETEDYTQCPYEILDITNGTNDLYVKYWIKIDSESVTKKNNNLWRTFFEFKTKDYAKGTGFRLIAFIYTGEDGIPYWSFQGDKDPEHQIWEINNKKVAVPLDEWFLTEFYWHWSENESGRVFWKINNQTIGDHYGPTTRNSKPIDFIMLFQIYGNENPKHQWIDDVELWNTIPYDEN